MPASGHCAIQVLPKGPPASVAHDPRSPADRASQGRPRQTSPSIASGIRSLLHCPAGASMGSLADPAPVISVPDRTDCRGLIVGRRRNGILDSLPDVGCPSRFQSFTKAMGSACQPIVKGAGQGGIVRLSRRVSRRRAGGILALIPYGWDLRGDVAGNGSVIEARAPHRRHVEPILRPEIVCIFGYPGTQRRRRVRIRVVWCGLIRWCGGGHGGVLQDAQFAPARGSAWADGHLAKEDDDRLASP